MLKVYAEDNIRRRLMKKSVHCSYEFVNTGSGPQQAYRNF